MTVLVTGGAGYIGSHMTYALLDRGEKVVVLDNLSTGLRSSVAKGAEFVEGDISDRDLVSRLVIEHCVEAAIHFAGSVVVPESVTEPLKYYRNNAAASLAFFEACLAAGMWRIIFSSTAAVYGAPTECPVAEGAPKLPITPYGRSKLMTEWMLEDAALAGRLDYVALRYFNVAGADVLGRVGQSTPNATHLVKRACQAALGRVPYLEIFGTDYPTHDGTGIRDYIHVVDLVSAHLVALDALLVDSATGVYNVGYGRGFSVREVIAAVETVSGRTLPVREAPRRLGDPPSVVADSTRLRSVLGWKPQHEDLLEIVRTAYSWERRLNS